MLDALLSSRTGGAPSNYFALALDEQARWSLVVQLRALCEWALRRVTRAPIALAFLATALDPAAWRVDGPEAAAKVTCVPSR